MTVPTATQRTYKLNEKLVSTISAKMRVVQDAQALMQSYVSGVADALEVPPGFVLDMRTWEFKPQDAAPKKE